MKVLLVSFFNDEAYGLRSLHSTLIENNIDAHMLFFKVKSKYFKIHHDEQLKKSFKGDINNASDHEIDLLVEYIKSGKFDVVGFSLVSSHFKMYQRIYAKIKNIDGMVIVLGGWQPSLSPEQCINYTHYLCIGEGELPFYELIVRLANKQSTDNIENFWINRNSTVIKNPVRPLTRDISSFPIPLFDHKYSHFIENNELIHYEPYFDNIRYGTFIGRGCPYHCTYCSNSYMANTIYPKSWSKIRYRSIDHMKREMLVVKEKLKHVQTINFYDEVFTPKLDWIREFFSWYQQEIKIPFCCFFFPGTCSDEKCRILANAGLRGVWMGVQSGSQRVRKEVFKRVYTNERILDQARIFHKYEVSVRYDFIFDNPFETFEESLESIYMMLELPQPFSLNLFSLKYFPNTEITKMALKAGIINTSHIDDHQENDQDTYYIREDVENLDDRFIDHLALYISYMSRDPLLHKQKDMIIRLIDDYKITKDITPVKKLLQPFLDR
jgi:anaerobic magnesium-protoporphyrin IX monomethyl ester cyclase